MQKQLEALSHLPSAIQMTLDSVSKQLASIVSARESSQEKEPNSEPEQNEDDHGRDTKKEEDGKYIIQSDRLPSLLTKKLKFPLSERL